MFFQLLWNSSVLPDYFYAYDGNIQLDVVLKLYRRRRYMLSNPVKILKVKSPGYPSKCYLMVMALKGVKNSPFIVPDELVLPLVV